jgi:hypothetical protein
MLTDILCFLKNFIMLIKTFRIFQECPGEGGCE